MAEEGAPAGSPARRHRRPSRTAPAPPAAPHQIAQPAGPGASTRPRRAQRQRQRQQAQRQRQQGLGRRSPAALTSPPQGRAAAPSNQREQHSRHRQPDRQRLRHAAGQRPASGALGGSAASRAIRSSVFIPVLSSVGPGLPAQLRHRAVICGPHRALGHPQPRPHLGGAFGPRPPPRGRSRPRGRRSRPAARPRSRPAITSPEPLVRQHVGQVVDRHRRRAAAGGGRHRRSCSARWRRARASPVRPRARCAASHGSPTEPPARYPRPLLPRPAPRAATSLRITGSASVRKAA